MKRRLIICILLLALFAVSLVSGFELGPELVTCGDFDCATPSDFWSNLGSATCQNNWITLFDRLDLLCTTLLTADTNTSQDISFKAERSYNVTLDVFRIQVGSGGILPNATIYISDNSMLINTPISEGNTLISWVAMPTIDGNLTINGKVNDNFPLLQFNSISVKEIIQPPNIIVRYDDKTAIIPQNYIERFDDGTIEITVPKNVFVRFYRWITKLA